MKLSKRFVGLAVLVTSLLSLNGCTTFRTSDFPIMIRLPASRECFEIKVMSGAEKRYPADQCDKMISKAIFLTSESWKLLKGDIQSNCQNAQCKQINGAADGLFLTIDKALQITPIP